jgi:hypothetical protein
MSDLTIAKTILSQLGGNRFIAMTGAKSFVGSDNSLTFRIGRNKTRCNYVQVIYNYGEDLYELRFGYVSIKKGLEEMKRIDGVYAEDLQRLFTDFTGLYTHI